MSLLERLRQSLSRFSKDDCDEPMYMIVGLGNADARYANNRHNIGFQIVDELAESHDLAFDKRQHKARVASGHIGNIRVLLVKPMDYMNRSGASVQLLAAYYKVDLTNLIVIYDDLDLPTGKLRLRPFGGAGGHNGMKSIIQRLGDNQFPRLRVGIDRPPGRMDPAAYVLQNFSKAEEEIMMQARVRAIRAIERWIETDIDTAMNEFNING